MNKLYKGIMLMATSAMLCSPLTVLAYDKTETVYTNLKYDGSIEKITVSPNINNVGIHIPIDNFCTSGFQQRYGCRRPE